MHYKFMPLHLRLTRTKRREYHVRMGGYRNY